MNEKLFEQVLDICHEVDLLVSEDPGTGNLEVLENARLKMNDYLMAEKYIEAENLAYAILLYHSGQASAQFISDEIQG
jgi:hypothetical protein